METLIVYPETPEKSEALKSVMKALGIAFDLEEDTTEYLFKSKANRESLEQSISEVNEGKVVKIDLNYIWK
jgi:hypothetical protein